jgi:hypothetical protein
MSNEDNRTTKVPTMKIIWKVAGTLPSSLPCIAAESPSSTDLEQHSKFALAFVYGRCCRQGVTMQQWLAENHMEPVC